MKTDFKDISLTRKKVIVKITSEEVTIQEDELLEEFQQQAKISGFRKGKAPKNIVRSRFAKDIEQELKQRVISKAHKEGVDNAGLEVYNIVELNDGIIQVGQEAVVTFTVDLIPDFELPAYEGIKVKENLAEASREEVDKMLDQLLAQRAEFNVADKAAEKGDYVQCSYEGKIGDKLISDLVPNETMYGTQKITWEEAGSEDSPGVRAIIDGLVGMKAGDSKEVNMDFQKDFKPETLAGKRAIYSIEVKEVREKVLPKMDEAFYSSLQVKNEDELRERITENITMQKKQHNDSAVRQQITEKLLKAVDIPIPESGIENETELVLREFMQRNMQQGVSADELDKHKNSLHEGANKAAHDRIKSRLIIAKIAEKEKIQVENDDFSRMIVMEAQQSGQNPEKLVKELRKDRDRINNMRREIILSKTMDLLVQKAERESAEDKDS